MPVPKHRDTSLFCAEEQVLRWADEVCGRGGPTAEEFDHLVRMYHKLYRQTNRLVKLGDRMQRQLNGLNEQLAAKEKKYRDIFENVAQGIFVSCPKGRFLEANRAMARLLGYDSVAALVEDVRDMGEQVYVDADHRQEFLGALLQHGQVQGHTLVLRRRDSERIVVEVFARAHFDGARLVRIEGVVADVTEKRRVLAELKEQARVDGLTGLYNRRHFMELCSREMARARRTGAAMSLVYFDVDHFKAINDEFGHEVGDRVLRSLAGLSRSSVRESDVLGRIGGEEFALLLPGSDLAGARCLAEKLRTAFQRCVVRTCRGEVRFTASFGLAEYSEDVGSVETLLRMADEALYLAKAGGRNVVWAMECAERTQL